MPVDGTFRTATDSAKVARGPSRGCGGISAVGAATNRAELATEMGLALWGEIHALGADRGSARHQSRMPTVSPASPDCSSMAWFYDPPEVLRAGLGSVGYDGGLDVADCSEGLDEVIRLAWAMLRANPDIIRWAGAVVLFEGGYLRHGERLDALLDEMATDVFGFTDVQCVGTSDPACKAQPGGIPQMFTTRYTGPIHVCSGASPSWEAIFRCGNRADKLGAIIDMARLLAHEITHLLGLAPGDNPGNCEVSFLFGNTVGWALGERYAKAKEGCFGNFWNEGSFNFLFMNDAEFLSDPPGPGSCPTSCAADTDTDGPVLGVLRYAGGGWDTQICILCPEACAGDQPVKGGPEADVWEDCLGAIAEAVLEETDTSTPLAKM